MKASTLRGGQITMTSLFPSRRWSSCETSQLHRMPTKTVTSTARRRSRFCRAVRCGSREGFSSCQRGPTIASERRRNFKPSRTNTQWSCLIVAFRRPSAKKAISGERQPIDDRSLQKESQNGQLWSGRRLPKLFCRHIVLI